MSAITNPSPAPVQAPRHPKPEAVPPAPPAPSGRKGWIWLFAVVLLGGIAYQALKSNQPGRVAITQVRTTRVTRAPLTKSLRISGVTAARNFAQVVAPTMRGGESRPLILLKLVPSGSRVNKGDLIAQIDGQSFRDHIDDLNALIQQADADVTKRKAEHAIEMENLRQNVRAAAAARDKANLDYGAQQIRSVIDQEILQIAVQEAEALYQELQGEIATTVTKHQAEIHILEATRDRHKFHRGRHQIDWDRLTIYASMNGLAVMQSIWRQGEMGQVQVGDQVSPGQPFMKIVDTSSMQLEGSVNQVESEGIRIGQTATLSFDAFSGMHLTGKVASVGAIGVAGWQQNYFIRNVPVRLAIEGSDPRLIPDLSACADVQLETQAPAVIAPLEAISSAGGKTVAYVRQGSGFAERQVELGPRNHTQVAVLAGLNPGDEIALGRPASVQP